MTAVVLTRLTCQDWWLCAPKRHPTWLDAGFVAFVSGISRFRGGDAHWVVVWGDDALPNSGGVLPLDVR
jgi:hypothetical protein